MSGALAAHDVVVTLGERRVLDGVSLSVAPGELVAVIGANGAGKSTLLRTLAGLAVPQSGRITLDGDTVSSLEARALARRVAYLPQERTVHWPMTVEHVVALGRLPHRSFAAAASTADRDAVRAAMERMDVLQFAQRSILALSGGERGRVLLARALAQGAQHLIADEPTAGLDPAHSLSMFEEFARLAAEGHAVIAALHDLSLAARFASRTIVLHQGVIFADGHSQSVIKPDVLAAAFGVSAVVGQFEGFPVVLPTGPLTRGPGLG